MWQEIAITLIGIGVIVWIGRKLYTLLTQKPTPNAPCSGCSGCALSKEINSKQPCVKYH